MFLQLHLLFNCAISNFKMANDLLFTKFGLKDLGKKIPPAPLPEGMLKVITNSDYYLENGVAKHVRLRSLDSGYARWLALVNCSGNCEVNFFSTLLQQHLAEYYNTHEVKMPNNCTITTLEKFYEYFAITMQRTYELGWLFVHGASSALERKPKEDKDFVDVFHAILPGWSFTELELDLVNIAWVVGGLLESPNDESRLKAGFHLKDEYKELLNDPVIPVSTRCRNSYLYAKKVNGHR
jgi:hypothetical protein